MRDDWIRWCMEWAMTATLSTLPTALWCTLFSCTWMASHSENLCCAPLGLLWLAQLVLSAGRLCWRVDAPRSSSQSRRMNKLASSSSRLESGALRHALPCPAGGHLWDRAPGAQGVFSYEGSYIGFFLFLSHFSPPLLPK